METFINSKNGAGYDPSVEDINPPREEDECELCGGECVKKVMISADEDIYYKCVDCGNIS